MIYGGQLMKGKVSTLIFVLSLIFSITAVVTGNSYYNRKQEALAKEVPIMIKTETKVSDIEALKVVPKEEKVTSEQKKAIDSALSDLISQGTVKSDFTLEDYQAVKKMVDALPVGTQKTQYEAEIQKIETAMTNMGINYK